MSNLSSEGVANSRKIANERLRPRRRGKSSNSSGRSGYLDRPEDLTLYEYDGSVDKARPELVVFPRTTEEVAAIVRITAEYGVPSRGAARARASAAARFQGKAG